MQFGCVGGSATARWRPATSCHACQTSAVARLREKKRALTASLRSAGGTPGGVAAACACRCVEPPLERARWRALARQRRMPHHQMPHTIAMIVGPKPHPAEACSQNPREAGAGDRLPHRPASHVRPAVWGHRQSAVVGARWRALARRRRANPSPCATSCLAIAILAHALKRRGAGAERSPLKRPIKGTELHVAKFGPPRTL